MLVYNGMLSYTRVGVPLQAAPVQAPRAPEPQAEVAEALRGLGMSSGLQHSGLEHPIVLKVACRLDHDGVGVLGGVASLHFLAEHSLGWKVVVQIILSHTAL